MVKSGRGSPDGFGVTQRPGPRLLRFAAVLVAATALVVPAGAGVAAAATVQTDMVTTPAPWISRVWPATGSSAGGDRVAITGHHFTGISTARFGGVSGTNLVVVSDTRITVTTPADAVGNFRVRLVGPGRSSGRDITYEFVDPPTVTGVSPSSGPIVGGTTVTVTGTHLGETCCVRVGGVTATDLDVISDRMLTVTTPAHAAGDVRVRVFTPDTSSSRSSPVGFTYLAGPAVTGISPSSGPTAGGTTVTITGTGFSGATSVGFGGSAAPSFVVVNDTTITAVTPPGTPGAVDVLVFSPGGSAEVVDGFTYV